MLAQRKTSGSDAVLQSDFVCQALVVIVIDEPADDVKRSFLKLVEHVLRFTREVDDLVLVEKLHEGFLLWDHIPVDPAVTKRRQLTIVDEMIAHSLSLKLLVKLSFLVEPGEVKWNRSLRSPVVCVNSEELRGAAGEILVDHKTIEAEIDCYADVSRILRDLVQFQFLPRRPFLNQLDSLLLGHESSQFLLLLFILSLIQLHLLKFLKFKDFLLLAFRENFSS